LPFNFSSEDVDEIASTSLLWLPFVVFVSSRWWLARRSLLSVQKRTMDIFFGTHLILWCLAKVSTTVHPACQPSVHFSGSFHIQPARCVFL
jgi:hypothetical protein